MKSLSINSIPLLVFLLLLVGCKKDEESTWLFPHPSHTATNVPLSCTACHSVTGETIRFPTMENCLRCHTVTEDDPWFQPCSECHKFDEDFASRTRETELRHRVACEVPMPRAYADVFFQHQAILPSPPTAAPGEEEYQALFPHGPHQEVGTTCDICHLPDGPAFTYPTVESCMSCHEIDEADSMTRSCGQCHTVDEEFTALLNPIQHRVSLEIPKPPSYASVRFDHRTMAGEEQSCLVCHGGDVEAEPYVEVHLPSMAECMAYARSAGKSTDCLSCHVKTEAPENETCLLCHRIDREDVGLAKMDVSVEGAEQLGLEAECSLCHREIDVDTPPGSHKRGDWYRRHGIAEDLVDRGQCALCHEENSCEMCHAVEQPLSHTNVWRNRVHGLHAAYERDRCMVCHREDSCDLCHREVSPRSHRAGWGAPQNRHCVRCHVEPGESVGCYACHREGRVQAVHQAESRISFSDPTLAYVHTSGMSCLVCHETLVPSHGLYAEDLCGECHRF